MASVAPSLHTYAEYLAAEEVSPEKHEFYQGHILAMAGGTVAHGLVKTNLVGMVYGALRGRPCRPFDADVRVRVEAADFTSYPDLSVVCGPVERAARDRHAIVNPTLLAEVLSPATASYDVGEKFRQYVRIPSLRAYLVVDAARPSVVLYERDGEDRWTVRPFGAGERVPIPALDLTLDVDALYDGWEAVREPEG